MLEIQFHPPAYYPECGFKYVVIGARYKDKWVFIKHKQRHSYEIPAGRINSEEDTDMAAGRELREETGAIRYKIECISTYTILENNKQRAGKLYYAEIESMGQEHDDHEIEKVVFSDVLPTVHSFPYVQTVLFDYLEKYRINKQKER
ncbi:MAG: NUDIX domain-containing protein [Bacteroidota bacterium]